MNKLTPRELLAAQVLVLYQRAAMIDDDVAALIADGNKEAVANREINRDAAVLDMFRVLKRLADTYPDIWEAMK